MKQYRHLFFDLDRTLWDYDTNSGEALLEVLEAYGLMPVFKQFDTFWKTFEKYNDALWELYRNGKIQKQYLRNRRFELTLEDFGIKDQDLAGKINEEFLKRSPFKKHLVDGAMEVLDYLKNKQYHLYILTNGFSHIQKTKMRESGLEVFFEQMVTSDRAGYNKPHRKIFEYAVKSVNARKSESLMIGDDLRVDIMGAQAFGMDQIYYNPEKRPHQESPTNEISHLKELILIL